MAFQRVGFFVVAIFELEVPPNVRVCYLFPLFYAWERISEVLSPPLLRPTAIAPPDHPPLATPRMCLIRTCPGFCFHRFVWGVRFASVSYLAYLCIFFTLNWYFDPLTSSTTSARADMPPRETSSVLTKYKTNIHIANTARWFGHASPSTMSTRETHKQASTPDFLQGKNKTRIRKKKNTTEITIQVCNVLLVVFS